jgi:branched-chain amino acid transport system substrate-binding protein
MVAEEISGCSREEVIAGEIRGESGMWIISSSHFSKEGGFEMKKMGYLLWIIALMTFLPLVATPQSVRAAEPIKIGAILDFTGPVADLGPKFKAGIELALEEAGYKVAGRDIKLIVEDGATDVTTALDKFKKLVEKDGIHICIGPLMGDAHLAIAPYAAENKVLITSLINGMYETIKYKTYIIYPTTVDAQTYPFGEYVYKKLGYKSVITIGANYAGKIGYTNGFAKGFQDAGGTVVQQLWPAVGSPDYSPYISTFKQADVVMYALEGPGPVSRFIYQYRQAGLKMPMVTITQDGDYTPEALKELGDIALGIQGESSYPWQLDTSINKKFVKAIKAKTGVVPSCSEQNSYTLTNVILAGLKATKGDDSFNKLWPAVLKLKMDTPQGPLSFAPEGVAITDMYVTEAQKKDGQYVLSPPLYTVKAVRDWRLPK